ncbi:hypothetical protein VPNG_07321 [Cytospora leucostoma]|uniref:Heterokaryon incompatibility domain-containing protein n=1 Tax=Cytospora leucostoma TaxID=1230097 RepID=A0A423WUJ9_9PEZI|nr:hypothetical protein VPNG_07321 [Cytospora leucostoma]
MEDDLLSREGALEASRPLFYNPLRVIGPPQVHEFRLLKIHRNHDQVIACDLLSFQVHHAPSYRALSYTWKSPFDHDTSESQALGETRPVGDTSDREVVEDILVNGQPVKVGLNLAAGLRAIRDWHNDGGDEFVWADAVCIDQANYNERAYQVAIMGEIYSNADSVVIWLGEEAQDSDMALSFLKALARCRRNYETGRARVLAMAQDPKCLRQWRALSALMRRRWFERAWVLQETVLARKALFCCGRTTLSDSDTLDGFQALWHAGDRLWDTFSKGDGVKLHVPTRNFMNGMTRVRGARLDGKLYSILTVHHRSMSLVATDPRDYVYAKISISNDGHLVNITYREPVDTVYTRFVLDYIDGKKSLDIIHFDARPRTTPGLPSWVPDWKAGFGAAPLQPGHEDNPDTTLRYFTASKGEPAKYVQFDEALKALVCKGYIIDTVDGVSRAEEASFMGSEPERPVSQSRSTQCAYAGGDAEIFEALWRTMTRSRDELDHALEPPAVATLVTSFLAAEKRLDDGQDPRLTRFDNAVYGLRGFRVFGEPISNRVEKSSQALEGIPTSVTAHARGVVEDALTRGMMFRRLITTEGGYLGTAPIETESGDTVALLFGSSVPVILRRSGGDGAYLLVGSANIHGVMYGEVFEARRRKQEIPETITMI